MSHVTLFIDDMYLQLGGKRLHARTIIWGRASQNQVEFLSQKFKSLSQSISTHFDEFGRDKNHVIGIFKEHSAYKIH